MLRCVGIAALSAAIAFGETHSDKQAMTVAQLSQALAGAAVHESDDALARRIDAIHLSERLTQGTLSQLEESLHAGPQTRQSLQLLADSSVFEAPPANELPGRPAPSAAEQTAMMNTLTNFVTVTMQRLPDFFATRTTVSYDNAPTVVSQSGWAPVEPMHADGAFRETITYRQGKEVTGERAMVEGGGKSSGAPGLNSSGEFGPLLATILRDATHGSLGWSRWESTATGLTAVFRYAVPARASHYNVDFCCVKNSEVPSSFAHGIPVPFHARPAYHGEIFLDPASGAVLRVTLEPEMRSSDPITRAGVAIDYGPVEIVGDKSYDCPVHSLALSVAEVFAAGANSSRSVTRINEVSFTGYHRFGATIRVVSPGGQP